MKKLFLLLLGFLVTSLYAMEENNSIFIKGYLADICNDDQGNVYYLQHDFENKMLNVFMADSLFLQPKLISRISQDKLHSTHVVIDYDCKKKQIHVIISDFYNQRAIKSEVFDLYIPTDRYTELAEKDFIKNKKLSKLVNKWFYERKYYQLGLSEKTNDMRYHKESFFYDKKCSQSGKTVAILEEEKFPDNEIRQRIYICNSKGKVLKIFQNQFIYINTPLNSRFKISNDRIYIFVRYSTVCNGDPYYRNFIYDLDGNQIINEKRDPRIAEIYDSLQKNDLSILDNFMSQLADSSIAITEEELAVLPENIRKVYLLYEELLSSTDYEMKRYHKGKEYFEENPGKYEIIPWNLTYYVSRDSVFLYGIAASGKNKEKITIKNIRPRVKSTKRVIYLDSVNDLLLTRALPASKMELLESLFNSTQTQMGPFHIMSNGSITIYLNREMNQAKILIFRSDVGGIKSYIWEKDQWIEGGYE